MPAIDHYDSVKMLNSSVSQYLPPDYLQPLPTALDAKISPLALLAQTCSSIGKELPSKSIIPLLEEKETSSKSPNLNNHSRDIKSSSVTDKEGKHSTDNYRQPKPNDIDRKDIGNFYPISTSSPKLDKADTEKQRFKDENETCKSDTKLQTAPLLPLSSPSSRLLKTNVDRSSPRPKTNEHSSDKCDLNYSPPLKGQRSESSVRQDKPPSNDASHSHSLYTGRLQFGPLVYTNVPYGPGAFAPPTEALVATGYAYGLPGQSSYSLSSAHALVAHQVALKSSFSAALSQYMQTFRMRNQEGLSGCNDPYCTNCVSALLTQNAHLPSQCISPSCAHCAHVKTFSELRLSGLAATNPLHSPFGAPPSASMGLSHLHSLCAQNLLTQGQPRVCNWMMGNDYCGKRFNAPEELLQHLRTHTSGEESALGVYGALGRSISSTEIGRLPGYLSTGENISPSNLRRLYPTSVSPLNASSLSNRYHPYKLALLNLPSGISPHQSLSSLGPYYSSYA